MATFSLSALSLLFVLTAIIFAASVKAESAIEKFDGSPWMLIPWIEAYEALVLVKEWQDVSNVAWKTLVSFDVLSWYLEQTAGATWDGVKALMKGYYLNDGVQARAFDALMSIRQLGTIESYNTYFTRLVQSIKPERLTDTILLNRYLTGLNRTLAKGVLARSPADWKRAKIDAMELAGTPAYTKAETSGSSSDLNKPKPKTTPKTAATTITYDQALQGQIMTSLLDDEHRDVALFGFVDTMSTYNLISPAVVHWLGYEVETSGDTPYHTVYTSDSRPIHLTQRIALALELEIDDRTLTLDQQYYYVLRIPYVHIIYGEVISDLIDQYKASVLQSSVESLHDILAPSRDYGGGEEIVSPPPRTEDTSSETATLGFVSPPPSERPDTGPYLLQAVPMTRPRAAPITIVRPHLGNEPEIAVVRRAGRSELRMIRGQLIQQEGRPMYGRDGRMIRYGKATMEVPELGWYDPDPRAPPPIFDPARQEYILPT